MVSVSVRNVRENHGTLGGVHGNELLVVDGYFVVPLGLSGCDKPTLPRMIAGLESVTGGDIGCAGSEIHIFTHVDGEEVCATTDDRVLLQRGAAIELAPRVAQAHLVDAGSGKVIA